MPLRSEEFVWTNATSQRTDVRLFADSYESFTRVLNNLQRQYLELKDEFAQQTEQAVQLNRELVRLSAHNARTNETLQSILHAVSFGIVAIDSSGTITHCNPAVGRLLGLPDRGLVGEQYREVIDPGEPAEANAVRSLERGQHLPATDRTLKLPDGSKSEFIVNVTLLPMENGRPGGAVEVWQDVSHIRRMEREITRLHTLAAMGQMAGTIAHQVRNPLSAIGGFAALLKRDMSVEDPRQRLVDKISQGVNRLNEMVTSLLNYARQEELRLEKCDASHFLRESVTQFLQDMPDCAAMINPIGAESTNTAPIILQLDPVLFRQVIMNLLTNAAQACDTGGSIHFSVRQLHRQSAVAEYADRLPFSTDETVVEFKIVDSGKGFSAEALANLFLPFFTTKRDGTGLGLAMASKIVKAHGGELIARNAKPTGAELIIILPTRISSVVPTGKGRE